MNTNKFGFSLIEVLIFVIVFTLFFIVAATIVTTSLRVVTTNQNKIKATHYVEELGEWLRSEKEINWGGNVYPGTGPVSSFTEQVTLDSPSTSFCFNTSPILSWPTSGISDCNYSLNNQFKRTATFTVTKVANYVNQINATITTQWRESGTIKSAVINKTFSIWE